MSDAPTMYIAGMGMITPIGANTVMTAAAARAGISAYQTSRFHTQRGGQPMTMTRVPRAVFEPMQAQIDQGGYQSAQYDRIVIMAIIALREALAGHAMQKPAPLILATPEEYPDVSYIPTELLIANLLNQKDLPLHAGGIRCLAGGRAAGIQGLALAQHFLMHQKADFVLVGGSDSYWDAARCAALDRDGRVLAPTVKDGFAPGEGAGFLLLTNKPERALARDGYAVGLSAPGVADEPGYLLSSETYRGDGLDQAFKLALRDYTGSAVRTIYSSMNGEHYWAKEYGVAFLRNRKYFHDPVNTEHPADGYGDLGAATAPVLIALAAHDLLNRHPGPAAHLVYSSSDGPARAAVRVEKVPRSASR